jgi:hypothetical protein
VFAISLPMKDAFSCVTLLNMLDTPDFANVRSQVIASLANSSADRPYTREDIVKQLDQEQLVINKSKNDEVLLARGRGAPGAARSRENRENAEGAGCANCGMKNHTKATWWRRGGGMEGK